MQRNTKQERIYETDKIAVTDNGEALVCINSRCPQIPIAAHWKARTLSSGRRYLYVREGLVTRLQTAQELLPAGYSLFVRGTFRPLWYQKKMFRMLTGEFRERHPDWPEEQLRKHVNTFIHNPHAITPPPHCTGGAVDLAVMDDRGDLLPMSLPFDDFDWGDREKTAATESPNISEEARRNRRILIEAMEGAGFVNYPEEWWHWSYGDSEWAMRSGYEKAIYGITELPLTARLLSYLPGYTTV